MGMKMRIKKEIEFELGVNPINKLPVKITIDSEFDLLHIFINGKDYPTAPNELKAIYEEIVGANK